MSKHNSATVTPSPPASHESQAPRWFGLLARGRRSRSMTTEGVLLFYIALIIYFWTSASHFMTYLNWVDIVSTASVVLIVSLGQSLTIISGGFDLSVGGVVPLGAVVFAALTHGHTLSVGLSMILVVIVGAAVGGLNAIVIAIFKVNPLIATLGTLSAAGGIAFTIAKGVTIQLPAAAGFLANNGPGGIPVYTFAAIGLSLIVYVVLAHTAFGRRIYVVGGNAEAARVAGISVTGVQFSVYMLSGILAAFAGIVYASQLLAAAGNVGSALTLTSVAAVVLGGAAITGGTGGVFGTTLGVLVLGTVADGMNLMLVPAFYQQIVTGGILLFAVSFSQMQGRFFKNR